MGESMVAAATWVDGDDKAAAASSSLEVSVSFGRFENDSLSWEKWSTFSPNKYLEEVGKYATPGSVAQKKAYFEAHYKKIAARKAAELLEEQQRQMDQQTTHQGEIAEIADLEGNGCGNCDPVTVHGRESEENGGSVEEIEAKTSPGEELEAGLNVCSVSYEVEKKLEPEIPPAESHHVKEEDSNSDRNAVNAINAASAPVTVTKQQKGKVHQQKKPSQKVKGTSPTSKVKDTPIVKKKLAASPAIQRPQNVTPKVSKPASSTVTSSSSRLLSSTSKKVNGNAAMKSQSTPAGGNKRVAPKSMHMSIDAGTRKSNPQPHAAPLASSARKSLIMETMGDKDIVKRAFKTFQSNFNQMKSLPLESTSGAKQVVPSTRSEVQVPVTKTPRNDNGGNRSYKVGDADKRSAKAAPSSSGTKSDGKAEKRNEKPFPLLKKMEGKSSAKEAESARFRAKSKEEKDVEAKERRRQSLNLKATPLPSFYKGLKVVKSPFDKETSKTLKI